MKSIFKQLSNNAILLKPEKFTVFENQNKWIGNAPATDLQITTAEKKLGIKLPADVIEFYKISNGSSEILYQTFGGFSTIDKIDWMKNIQAETFEDYEGMGDDYVNHLKNSIIIAGENHPHQVLIIQPFGENKDWQYWEFAFYIPGENKFKDIKSYLERLCGFLADQIKNKP